MSNVPDWVLLLAFWLHMLATIAWLGYLAATTLWIGPAIRNNLERADYFAWLQTSNRRLIRIGWLSIGVLSVSGLIQMTASQNYEGLLVLGSNWATAMFIKHLVFFGMIAISAYISWGIQPQLERIELLKISGNESVDETVLVLRQSRLMWINLLLGIATLALTSLARIS